MKILKQKDLAKLRTAWLKENGYKDPVLKQFITSPTLDHDHVTGYCRGTLDRDVNQFLGKVESAYKRFLRHKTDMDLDEILNQLSIYLIFNKQVEEILHPKHISILIRRFSRMTLNNQKKYLQKTFKNEIIHESIIKSKSKKELILFFRQKLKNKKYTITV